MDRDRDIGPTTATFDPRPRLWTRDPLPATISQTPLRNNITRYDRCIIYYIRQMYLNLEKAVFKFFFFHTTKALFGLSRFGSRFHSFAAPP